MVPIQKFILGTLAALVLILTTYICADTFRVEVGRHKTGVDDDGSSRVAGNTPTRLPDFAAAKPIAELGETQGQLEVNTIVSSNSPRSRQLDRHANSGNFETSQSYPPQISNWGNDSNLLKVSTQNVVWQYPSLAIPTATVANFQKKMAYGKKLARVGALASAEKESQLALKLVAESLDFSTGFQSLYAKKIDEAFVTLNEMADFRAENSDLVEVIQSHATPILKNEHAANLSRNSAQLAYLSYAEEQLIGIFANYSFCSDAFFTLGKIFLSSRIGNENTEVATMKAMLMFRMAVSLNPADSQSANELGAMYAGLNYLDVAKEYFVQSVSNSPTPTAWKNLARIHRMLGEHQLAAQAENEFRIASQGFSQKVTWVTPDEFGRTNQIHPSSHFNNSNVQANRHRTTPTRQQPGFQQPVVQQPGLQQNASQQPAMMSGHQPRQPDATGQNQGRVAGIPFPNIMNLWK